MPLLTPPPSAPQRGDRATFAKAVDAFIRWLINFVTELGALVAGLNSLAAGGAYAIPYAFTSTPNTIGLAAGGNIAFNTGATAQTANTLYLDTKQVGGASVASSLSDFNASTSAVKGIIRVVKMGDASKWARFSVAGYTAFGSYGAATVTPLDQSSANPFTDADAVMLYFQRTGDKGDQGITGQSGIQIFHIREERANNVDATAGTFISGAIYRRPFNTVKTAMAGASLTADQFILPAGTYEVDADSCMKFVADTNTHRLCLYDVAAATYLVVGTSPYLYDTAGTGDPMPSVSSCRGVFTLGSPKTLELREILLSTQNIGAWGIHTGSGQVEVYSQAIFRKIA